MINLSQQETTLYAPNTKSNWIGDCLEEGTKVVTSLRENLGIQVLIYKRLNRGFRGNLLKKGVRLHLPMKASGRLLRALQ